MIWAIVGFILLALITGFLLLPLVIEINSDAGVYEFRLGGWMKYRFSAEQLLAPPAREKKKPGRKRRTYFRSLLSWKNIRRVLASFEVRRFRLILDTDDFILNAYLYPVFVFLSGKNRFLAINFQGRNAVDILVTNRMWRILWALIRNN
jgi:hypothetical protein